MDAVDGRNFGNGSGVEKSAPHQPCEPGVLGGEAARDLEGVFAKRLGHARVQHGRLHGRGRDDQNRGRLAAGVLPVEADQPDELGKSLPDRDRRQAEAPLGVVRAEHEDHEVERIVAHQAGRKIACAALVAAFNGVVVHAGAPAKALLDHGKALAERRRKPHRPSLVLAVAAAPRVVAIGVGIAKAKDSLHLLSPTSLCGGRLSPLANMRREKPNARLRAPHLRRLRPCFDVCASGRLETLKTSSS